MLLRFSTLVLISSALMTVSCAKEEQEIGTPPVLEVPYDVAQEASIQVDNVFVATDYSGGGAPFGVHVGMHFSPTAAHNADMPYYAMADGTIAKVESLLSGGFYNVNVQLEMSGGVIVVYQFETQSAIPADETAQLAKISVSEGQAVSSGDLIGTLHDAGVPAPIMHIGVIQGPDLICPTHLMSSSAASRTIALIERDNASWLPCYEN